MVTYISWKDAQTRVREEPVIFAEVVSQERGGQKLEVHVMVPTDRGLHEAERNDTGHITGEAVDRLIERIAVKHRVRYAAMRGAEDHWPPEWMRRA